MPQMELKTKEAAASAEEASKAQKRAYQERGPDHSGSSGRVASAGDCSSLHSREEIACSSTSKLHACIRCCWKTQCLQPLHLEYTSLLLSYCLAPKLLYIGLTRLTRQPICSCR